MKIAILDDDADKRGTLLKNLRMDIDDESIDLLETDPLPDATEYPRWIQEEGIDALVMDWRLNETSPEGKDPVTYEGDVVVKSLRARLPFLPIFVLTAYEGEDDVTAFDPDVELIDDRKAVGAAGGAVAKKLLRAAARYSERKKEQIASLTLLAIKVARGEATSDEKKQLLSLQEELHLPTEQAPLVAASDVLEEAGKLRIQADELIEKINKVLEENGA